MRLTNEGFLQWVFKLFKKQNDCKASLEQRHLAATAFVMTETRDINQTTFLSLYKMLGKDQLVEKSENTILN